MGLCREVFGHFVLMSEVSTAAVFCRLQLNYAPLSSLHLVLLLLLLLLLSHSFVHISLLVVSSFPCALACHCLPSFRPAISTSDPLVRNCCIFNPYLDNGAVTVTFALELFSALRPFMSLTLYMPLLPVIDTLTNPECCHNSIYVYERTISSTSILISAL